MQPCFATSPPLRHSSFFCSSDALQAQTCSRRPSSPSDVRMAIDPSTVGTGYAFLDGLKGVVIGPTINEFAAAIAGGTVGVMGTLITLEIRRQKRNERKQCPYCIGTGKLPCGHCYTLGYVPCANSVTAQRVCDVCGGPGYVECNHCHGDGRLIPFKYERALRGQEEDFVYMGVDDQFDRIPPFF